LIALSTTEAEYIALSMAMREVIPTMNLLKEISVVIGFEYQKPTVKSKAFSIEFL